MYYKVIQQGKVFCGHFPAWADAETSKDMLIQKAHEALRRMFRNAQSILVWMA